MAVCFYYQKYVIAYSSNVLIERGGSVVTIADPSTIRTSERMLKEHAKLASYEPAYVWGQALKLHPQMLSSSDWGWVKQEQEEWKVLWTPLLPPIRRVVGS